MTQEEQMQAEIYSAISGSMVSVMDHGVRDRGLDAGTLLVGFLGDLVMSRGVTEEELKIMVNAVADLTTQYRAEVHPANKLDA